MISERCGPGLLHFSTAVSVKQRGSLRIYNIDANNINNVTATKLAYS